MDGKLCHDCDGKLTTCLFNESPIAIPCVLRRCPERFWWRLGESGGGDVPFAAVERKADKPEPLISLLKPAFSDLKRMLLVDDGRFVTFKWIGHGDNSIVAAPFMETCKFSSSYITLIPVPFPTE